MTDALVENLRRGGYEQPNGRLMMTAAAEIERLRAENERLRKRAIGLSAATTRMMEVPDLQRVLPPGKRQ